MVRVLGALALACAALLGGCRAPALRVTDIQVAKDASFDLMSPASLGQSISLEQIVEAKDGEREFTFHCLLEVDPEQLVLVGMTPFNTRAFTLTLTGESLTIDMAPGAQLPAEPSRILADLQLALWPDPQVAGLERTKSQSERGFPMRVFQRGDAVVIGITYDGSVRPDGGDLWGKRLVFEQLEQNYSLTVTTVRAEKLAP